MANFDDKIQQEMIIRTAAGWREDDDSAYKAFQDLMKRRKEVAIDFLEEGDRERQQQLKELILHINKEIRAVLAL